MVYDLLEPIGDLLMNASGFALYLTNEQSEVPDLQAEIDQVGNMLVA